MPWTVRLHPAFVAEIAAFPVEVGEEIAALTELREQFGPQLRRPYCDTLNGSECANMKELRFVTTDGV